jgi:hypothetical protein
MKTEKFYVGISGHRELGDNAVLNFVQDQIEVLLVDLKQNHEKIIALSALAKGADTVFAEIALKQCFELEVIIPFSDYEGDFDTHESLQSYQMLSEKATKIHQLRFKNRSNEAYLAGGYWIVDHCDLLVVVWNGKPAVGKGGTGDVVKYAKGNKRCFWHINTATLNVMEVNYGYGSKRKKR